LGGRILTALPCCLGQAATNKWVSIFLGAAQVDLWNQDHGYGTYEMSGGEEGIKRFLYIQRKLGSRVTRPGACLSCAARHM